MNFCLKARKEYRILSMIFFQLLDERNEKLIYRRTTLRLKIPRVSMLLGSIENNLKHISMKSSESFLSVSLLFKLVDFIVRGRTVQLIRCYRVTDCLVISSSKLCWYHTDIVPRSCWSPCESLTWWRYYSASVWLSTSPPHCWPPAGTSTSNCTVGDLGGQEVMFD